MGELLDRLRTSTVFDAVVWEPREVGEGREGILLSIETRAADENRRITAYPIWRVRCDDGTSIVWHASGQMARDEIDRLGPMIGDRVAILFGGEDKAKNGNRFGRWALAVEWSPGRRLHERMVAVDDVELRHRVKRTFARVWRSPFRLDADALVQADAWITEAIAGRVELDEVTG